MITRVEIDFKLAEEHGIHPVTFRDLRNVVLFAGANGSGKSRYLVAVRTVVARAAGTAPHMESYRRQNDGNFAIAQKSLDAVSWTEIPRVPKLLDAASVSLRSGSIDIPELGGQSIEGYPLSMLAKDRGATLQGYAQALFDERHPDLKDTPDVIKKAEIAREFSKTLEVTLGTPLGYSKDVKPRATLFGRPYADAELSAGQQLLLIWALLLHQKDSEVSAGSVLFIDEPERHLHPKAAIDMLDRIRDLVGSSGQLWVATHSPSVVAHLGGDSLYGVEKNEARYSGSRMDGVMDGLLGGPQGRSELREFLADTERLNFLRFAVQSIFPPTVSGHRSGDDQEHQFASVITLRLASEPGNLRILDYGAGKGRFAVALADSLTEQVRKRVEYFAYNDDDHDEYREECVRSVSRLHSTDAEKRVTSNIGEFSGENRVDLMIMCNFLHEIEPHKWKEHLTATSEMLVDDGELIIFEDQEPSVGELPSSSGFVIFDLAAFQELFRGAGVRALVDDERLTAFVVPKEALSAYTDDNLRVALEETRKRALVQLRAIRRRAVSGPSQLLGRKHALYVLLLANTELVLSELQRGKDELP